MSWREREIVCVCVCLKMGNSRDGMVCAKRYIMLRTDLKPSARFKGVWTVLKLSGPF